jgi:hypothetical protein
MDPITPNPNPKSPPEQTESLEEVLKRKASHKDGETAPENKTDPVVSDPVKADGITDPKTDTKVDAPSSSTDALNADVKGGDLKGADTKGDDTKGADTKGADTKGGGTKGGDTKGSTAPSGAARETPKSTDAISTNPEAKPVVGSANPTVSESQDKNPVPTASAVAVPATGTAETMRGQSEGSEDKDSEGEESQEGPSNEEIKSESPTEIPGHEIPEEIRGNMGEDCDEATMARVSNLIHLQTAQGRTLADSILAALPKLGSVVTNPSHMPGVLGCLSKTLKGFQVEYPEDAPKFGHEIPVDEPQGDEGSEG